MARLSLIDVVLVAAVAAAAVLLLWPRGHGGGALRASWALTPGVVNPDVTSGTISQTICSPGWTRTIRPPTSYTSALKLEQLRRLGLPGGPSGYQEDHLISLELGGHPTDRRNLWPERRPRADEVDRVENELNAKICSGRLTLRAAQEKISAIKHAQG
jgi:hypothetical protein